MATAALAVAIAALSVGLGWNARAPGRVDAPAANVLVNQDHNPVAAHDTPALARNPARATNLVVVDRVERPAYTATVHVSMDGGHTWRDTMLRLPAASAYHPAPSAGGMGTMGSIGPGDPMAMAGMDAGPAGGAVAHKLYAPKAAFDATGELYVLFVTLSGPGNRPDGVWIERSGDGGLTFSRPAAVAGPLSFQVSLAVDPGTGRLFAVWLQGNDAAANCLDCFATTGLPIVAAHSDDGGRTWSNPVRVSDAGRARIGAPALALDRHGNPVVLYYDYGADTLDWNNLPGVYRGRFSLVLARSPDRGASFGPGQVIDSRGGRLTKTRQRPGGLTVVAGGGTGTPGG